MHTFWWIQAKFNDLLHIWTVHKGTTYSFHFYICPINAIVIDVKIQSTKEREIYYYNKQPFCSNLHLITHLSAQGMRHASLWTALSEYLLSKLHFRLHMRQIWWRIIRNKEEKEWNKEDGKQRWSLVHLMMQSVCQGSVTSKEWPDNRLERLRKEADVA